MNTRRAGAIIVVVAALLQLGCASSRTFLHADADFGFYERVGVLPFASLTTDRLAGEKVSSVFTSHLLASGLFDVVEPGHFLSVYQQQVGSETPPPIGLPPERLKALGEATSVQGVFEGTVRNYELVGGSSPRPLLSVEVRLVDVASGRIVWSTSVTDDGGRSFLFLGMNRIRSLAELTERVASRIVEEIEP
jgi:curli biogenesis system outer membrane secretion channel CsgG